MSDIGHEFILAFSSRPGCMCGNPLNEGDEARYVDKELVCKECGDEAVDEADCLLKQQIENRNKKGGK